VLFEKKPTNFSVDLRQADLLRPNYLRLNMTEAIKRGDEIAFRQAYDEYKAKVYGYFFKKTRAAEDSRDLLQTTFLKLWKYRGSLSAEYLLEQQLFHICRTVFIDYLRKQSRTARVIESRLSEMPEPSQHYNMQSDFDLRSRLGTALSAMPELRKKIFELNRLQGYSYQEIAQHLSISVKSVDNNLTKAVKFLRKTMLFILILFY
jgi:RNA polymerase sigma factor (sigma-70 family)